MAQDKKQVTAITPRDKDFAQWFTDVVVKAELIDYSSVKGMFILRPYGYAIWENIMHQQDARYKELGHENVAMPMLIPESLLLKEAEHVAGSRTRVRLGHLRRQRSFGGASGNSSHLRDPVLRSLGTHRDFLERSAQAVQPVGERAALGEDLPSLPPSP